MEKSKLLMALATANLLLVSQQSLAKEEARDLHPIGDQVMIDQIEDGTLNPNWNGCGCGSGSNCSCK